MDIKALLKKKYYVYSAILIVSIIVMLLGIRFSLMEGHGEIKKYVATNISDIESSFTKDSETVLKGLGEEIIRLKAERVAKDIENYLIRHPRATIKDMQNDPQFKPIAIQPVGKTGYTAVHEANTSINRFHVNPKIINTGLSALASGLPDFWKIIVAAMKGKNAGGYYKWREADGSVREKYMWVATVSRPTADGIILDVAATTYIDEFMQPLVQLSEKFHRESNVASARVVSASERTQGRTLIAIVMIILIFCGIAGYVAFRLIQAYRRIEREIEERKKIESELQKLAEVVEQSGELINLATLDGKMIFLNKAGGTMLGIPPGDVEKHSIMEVIPDELKSKVENELLPNMLKKGRWEGDLQYQNLITGALTDVHVMAFTICNSDGEPLYLANVSLDITDRKRAEEALQEQGNKMLSIFRAAPVGIGLVIKRVFYEANDMLCSMTGYSREELLGQDALMLYPTQEDYDYVGQEKYRQIVEKNVGTVETRWKKKDGTVIQIILSSTPLDPDDLAKGVTFTALDITSSKRAEETLRESEANYRQLFDNAPTAIYQINFRTGKFLKANDVLCEFIGCSQEEITSLNPYDFMTKESQKLFLERLNKMAQGDKVPEDPEYEIIDKNGKRRWVQLKSKNIYDSEGLVGADVVAHDITERKEQQKKIEHLASFPQLNPIMILEVRRDKEVIFCNPAMQSCLNKMSIEDPRIFITEDIWEFFNTTETTKRGEYVRELQINDNVFLENIHFTTEFDSLRVYTTDITDRKRAEEELRDSESKYQFLAESMADVVFTLDINLVTTYVSPSIERMLGFTPKERMAQKVDQQLTPKSQKLVFELLIAELDQEKEKGMDPNRSQTLELEFYHKDGSIKHLVTYIRGIRDSKGNLTGFYGSHHDITERKRAEEMLRLITENMSDMIRVTDLQGVNLYASPSHLKSIGYTAEERAGKSTFDIVHPDDVEHIIKVFSEGLVNNKPSKLEYRVKHKEGHYVWLETIGDLLKNDRGEVTAVIMSSRDVTARRKAEDELREANQKLRLHFEQTPMAVIEWDLDFRVTQWNPAAQAIFGFSHEEAFGQHASIIVPEGFRPHVDQVWQALLKISGGERSTNQNVRRDGTMILCEWYNTPLVDEIGTVTGVASLVQDITTRRQAEEKLRESQEQYRTLVENASDIVFRTDNSGYFTFVNPAGIRITGYEEKELIGKHYPTLIRPDMRDEAIKSFGRQFVKGIQNTYSEYPILTKEGHEVWLGQNTQLIVEDGNVTGFQAVSRDITDRKRAEEELRQTLDSLRKAFGATIQVMVSAVEARDPYTAGHQIRSADLARAIATEMGLPQEKIEGIRMAGSIHDIGKLSIPAEILSKPTKLTNIEFSLIKEHSLKGYEMLKDVESPWPLAEIVYQHHERTDGTGYPRNLKGDEILIEARILCVADVVEAMASHRPYRPAIGIKAALDEIENNKGRFYDADAVDACLRLFLEKGFNLERI